MLRRDALTFGVMSTVRMRLKCKSSGRGQSKVGVRFVRSARWESLWTDPSVRQLHVPSDPFPDIQEIFLAPKLWPLVHVAAETLGAARFEKKSPRGKAERMTHISENDYQRK